MARSRRRQAARARGRRPHALGDRDRAAAKQPVLRLYLDTSAFVSGLLREPASSLVAREAPPGSSVVTSVIAYVEVRAALAAARRARRLTASQLGRRRRDFDLTWDEIDRIEIDDDLVQAAGIAAERFALRAGDAVHLASAIAARDVTLLTLDRDLARAASDAGLKPISV